MICLPVRTCSSSAPDQVLSEFLAWDQLQMALEHKSRHMHAERLQNM